MKFNRLYTAAGQDPLACFNFVTRSAKIEGADGRAVVEADGLIVPDTWSQTAVDILARNYLRKAGVPNRTEPVFEVGIPTWLQRSVPAEGATFGAETDVRQVFRRMAGCYTYWGWRGGYFDVEEDAQTFHDELIYTLAAQMAAPNSPAWFNLGLHWAYGTEGEPSGQWAIRPDGGISPCPNSYERPQIHACFTQIVNDTLLGDYGIQSLIEREARVFKHGGGSGCNYSNLRGKGEPLSGGGVSSGLMSWLNILDNNAGSIKSGGTCLAPHTAIYTHNGPVPVKDLAESGDRFVCLSYDPPAGRYKAKWARAWKSGRKTVVHVITDKGSFDVSYDHPMRLSCGRYVEAGLLTPGMSMFACAVDRANDKHFGSYAGMLESASCDNHRVVRVDVVGEDDVYDVQVDCPTPDELTEDSGHNFVIWPSLSRVGSGVAVHNTRRAARIVVVDDDHPDVEAFIGWKKGEEYKVRCLVEGSKALTAAEPGAAVFDTHYEGEAYATVGGQNANNSVRVSDAFMAAARGGQDWKLVRRTDGKASKTLPAQKLWEQVVDCAWSCADPGLMFGDTVNAWHTCPKSGSIRTPNPCGEFLFSDDNGCNLASLNLARFFESQSGQVDLEKLRHSVHLWTVALDITVSLASYPSDLIAKTTAAHRTLGLSGVNYGALLMVMGLPYDSETGRAVVAALAAVIHGTAYATSAELASRMGTFPAFDKNREDMLRVIRNHRWAAYDANPSRYEGLNVLPQPLSPVHCPYYLWQAATEAADAMLEGGKQHGFRNAHVTLVPPSGTIGLIMGCDTTGLEPDFALVKFKKLSGGGTMKIVNRSVAPALRRLGYSEEQVQAIVAYVEDDAHWTVEGAPHLREEHYPVFDCANRCGPHGRRFIAVEGHVKMLAAVQPFLSGAASKTVNLPNEATREDVANTYLLAWQLGVKDIALYRDGCKLSQPLNAVAEDKKPAAVELPAVKRRNLPGRRYGYTQKATIGGQSIFLRTGEYEDGTLGEIFVDLSKAGTTLRSLFNSLAIAVSLGLQHGVPLDEYVHAFLNTKFEPSGMVQGHPTIKTATSLIDWVVRELAISYLGWEELQTVPKPYPRSEGGRNGHTRTEKIVERVTAAIASVVVQPRRMGYEGDACRSCGQFTLIKTGACAVCETCGATSGCG
jgi:ribonucleoside-diphosphate reductase alpha chain